MISARRSGTPTVLLCTCNRSPTLARMLTTSSTTSLGPLQSPRQTTNGSVTGTGDGNAEMRHQRNVVQPAEDVQLLQGERDEPDREHRAQRADEQHLHSPAGAITHRFG